MKILIIGKNSFIAGYFITACRDNGIDYVGCSHSDIPKKFDGFDWVVNFTINPKFFTHKYSKSIDQDAVIATQVSKYQNVKYVMISSRTVYGRNNSLTPKLEGFNVKDNNNSIYACNKIYSEQYCKSIFNSDDLLIVRGGNIFGYEYGRKSFTGMALNRLRCKSEILLDVSEKTVRDFIPVNCFSDCLIKLVVKNCTGVYNIGSGLGTSLEEICSAIIAGYGGGSVATSGVVVVKDQFILDIQKLLDVLGYSINKSDVMQYARNVGKRLRVEQGVQTHVS